MRLPDWFAAAVRDESGGHLRARWSPALNRVFIEQRRARAHDVLPPALPEDLPRAKRAEAHERWVRAMDGYDLLLEIAPGDRAPCPRCGGDSPLPVMRVAEARCPGCGHTWRACYWPLNDALLQHLRWGDPARGGVERVFGAVDASEEQREQRMRRDRHRRTEEIFKDERLRLFNIPQVGYTGRSWEART